MDSLTQAKDGGVHAPPIPDETDMTDCVANDVDITQDETSDEIVYVSI